jgi:hypothetical protein
MFSTQGLRTNSKKRKATKIVAIAITLDYSANYTAGMSQRGGYDKVDYQRWNRSEGQAGFYPD